MDPVEQVSQRLKPLNKKVAEACKAHVTVYELMEEVYHLAEKYDGQIPITELPEQYQLEVSAYGPEQALKNYQQSLKATRDYVVGNIAEYYLAEKEALREAGFEYE